MTDIDFRDIILNGMDRRGWNAVRLSAESGVSTPQIYRYLHGDRDLSAAALARLLSALGVRVTPPRERARDTPTITGDHR